MGTMHGLRVHNVRLDQVLAPVATTLDQCWWYLGGAGMRFPWIQPPRRHPAEPATPIRRGPGRYSAASVAVGPLDPTDWERYVAESNAAQEEYAKWLEACTGSWVGKPGFFTRYAAGMEGDWRTYFVSDAPVLRCASLEDAARRFDRVWFDAPPDDLGADICLITRNVDDGYLDLFFRDEWAYQTVRGYLDGNGIKCSRFMKLDFDPPRDAS